jgi:DNA-binding LacI/PurR family transcriptional regulator
MKSKKNLLPFRIVRDNKKSLVEQMADGLRNAIMDGYYPVDEFLPRQQDLAEAAGVSIRIAREAIAWLRDEGLIEPKRHVGAKILPKGAHIWRGHVLSIVLQGTELSFWSNTIFVTIQQHLCNAGYFFSRIILPKSGQNRWDTRALDTILRERFDLAIIPSAYAPLVQKIKQSQTPYLIHRNHKSSAPLEIAAIRYDFQNAVDEFAASCKKNRIRSAVEISHSKDIFHVSGALRKLGIKTSSVRIQKRGLDTHAYLNNLMQDSLAATANMLSRKNRPDLVYFSDDFIANGGLMALLEQDVDIPGDLCVVSLANAGFLPVFTKSLSRLEVCPVRDGETIAEAALCFLSGKKIPPIVNLTVSYIPGDTFPSAARRKKPDRFYARSGR